MGIGVMLAVLHRTGKLPAAIRSRKIFANLRAILFKNKGKYYVDQSYHGDWDPLDIILFQTI